MPIPTAEGDSGSCDVIVMKPIDPSDILYGGIDSDEESAYEDDDGGSSPDNSKSITNESVRSRLTRLRITSHLDKVMLDDALSYFSKHILGKDKSPSASCDRIECPLDETLFSKTLKSMYKKHKIDCPSDDVVKELFSAMDADGNGILDASEMLCSLSVFCAGEDTQKMKCVFNLLDQNNSENITPQEMTKFLQSVFRVTFTPDVAVKIEEATGQKIQSADELARVSTEECFAKYDTDKNGSLSFDEFKQWFYAPFENSSFHTSPLKNILASARAK